jgi:hypothetical protein
VEKEDGAAVGPFAGGRVQLRAVPSNGLPTGALYLESARTSTSGGSALCPRADSFFFPRYGGDDSGGEPG